MRHKSIILIMLLLGLSISQGAYAQNKNSLSIPDIIMSRGSEATLSVFMDNVDEITAVEFTLEVPDGITINPSSASPTERAKNHSITARKMKSGKYKFLVMSDSNAPIADLAGMLFSVQITADESLTDEKDYPLTISDAVMSLKSGENVWQEANGGKITIKSLPNLHVVSLDCSDPVAGSEITIKWKVRNDGRGSTEEVQWKDYIWLVPNIEGGTSMRDSKLLKTVSNVTALQPGESYENTVNVQLAERIYGNYDLVVITDKYGINNIKFNTNDGKAPRPYTPEADGYSYGYPVEKGEVLEENETNTKTDNFFYRQIDIAVPPLADLQVPSIIATVIPTTDLPPMAAAPRRNTGIVVDVPEPTEDELLMPWYEAYIPNALSAANLRHSNAFYSGKKIKVKVKIANMGGKDTQKSFKTVLYMSSSPDIQTATMYAIDSQTCKEYIPAGGETILTFAFYLPYEWYGDTYFHAYADIDDEVYELANTANNWGVSSNYNVQLCPGADFVPSKLKSPSKVSSGYFDVSYQVKNQGAGIPYSNKWTDKVYLSKKSSGLDNSAIEIGHFEQEGRFTSNLPMMSVGPDYVTGNQSGTTNAYSSFSNSNNTVVTSIYTAPEDLTYEGDSYSANHTVKIPNPSTGTYYIYIKVDADNDIFEFDGEENNILCTGPVQVVVPDLAVELVSISEDKLVTDNQVALTWKLKNVGSADIQNVEIKDAFYAKKVSDGNTVNIGTVSNTVSIVAGGEKTLRTNITIPRDNNLSGSLNVFVKTNIENSLVESSLSNNTSNAIAKQFVYVEDPEVALVNGTNLSVSALQLAASADPGETIAISYTIRNSGTLSIGKDVMQEIFISKADTYDSSAKALSVSGNLPSVSGLRSGASVKANVNISIPADMRGGKSYIYVVINRNKALAEKKSDDNQISKEFFVNGNLPNLSVTNLVVPSTIKTSEKTEVTWKLSNTGTWDAEAVSCGIYLSKDATLDKDAVKLTTLQSGKLAKNASENMKSVIELDDQTIGKYYIFVKADNNNSLEESTKEDNLVSQATLAKQSPLPDLNISDLTVDGVLRPGTEITVKAKVQNVGDDATHIDKWNDVFYLSTDFSLNPANAILVGKKMHVGKVEKDGAYDLSAVITIPSTQHGYCFLYAKTDGNDTNIEKDKNNNITRTKVYVENNSDTPAELAVKSISAPSSIKAGAPVTISYTLENSGQFPANGTLREVLYLSIDQQWDEDDQMVGVVSSAIDLAAGNEEIREVTGRITNVVEGTYYLIVRTNSTHTIPETDYTNNTTVAKSTTSIDYATLALESTSAVNTSGYYKLTVNSGWSGRTIGLYLSHDSEVPAGLYVSYNKVPSTARHERSSNVIETTEQELLIPNVQEGNYYILAQDNNAIGLNLNEFTLNGQASQTEVPMLLSAKEVHFGASSLSIKEGGTDGWLTTEIHGALLDSIMDFRLVQEGKAIPVEAMTFHDQTSSHATFNLHDAKTGSYDVVSELPNGSQATLPDGFKVIPGQSVNLGVKMDLPGGARSSFYAPFSIAYANGGNTDIAIKELLVVTDNGVLATTVEGLKDGKKELHIVPDFGQDNRGYVNIPPGTQKVINCFIEVSSTSNVTVYIVK